MLEKKQVLRILPFGVLFLLGWIAGICGVFYIPNDHAIELFYILVIVHLVIGGLLGLVWCFSPLARKNEASGVKSGALMVGVCLFEGVSFSIVFVCVLFNGYISWLSIPFAILVGLLQIGFIGQLFLLSQCRLPPLWSRVLFAWPAAILFTSIFLSFLSCVLFPFISWVPFGGFLFCVPLLLSLLGLYQTTYTPSSSLKWKKNNISWPAVSKNKEKVKRSKEISISPLSTEKPSDVLRIIQITDPHLGTMTSIARLRTICEQAVELNPDIILLTGDLYTVEAYEESQHAAKHAFEPLTKFGANGKLFACMGNHDYEHCAKKRATEDLAAIGAKLLIGQSETIETSRGKVQVVGLDYMRPGERRTEHIDQTMSTPVMDDVVLRIVMLHDPGAFKLLPDQQNLVFSGHTHGGQFGLLSVGINATLVGLAGIPDQGYFEKGTNRLYVHRAHGCRSALGTLACRVGCPPEFSFLDVTC